MSNALYVARNPHVDLRLDKLANDHKLITCYRDKHQRVLKNEKLIVSQKKKYIFLRVLSDKDISSLPDLYQYLAGAHA